MPRANSDHARQVAARDHVACVRTSAARVSVALRARAGPRAPRMRARPNCARARAASAMPMLTSNSQPAARIVAGCRVRYGASQVLRGAGTRTVESTADARHAHGSRTHCSGMQAGQASHRLTVWVVRRGCGIRIGFARYYSRAARSCQWRWEESGPAMRGATSRAAAAESDPLWWMCVAAASTVPRAHRRWRTAPSPPADAVGTSFPCTSASASSGSEHTDDSTGQ